MALIDPAAAVGDVVKMARNNPLHLAGIEETLPAADAGTATGIEQTFGNMLASALGSVNTDQVTAMSLSQKMVTDPTSVNGGGEPVALPDQGGGGQGARGLPRDHQRQVTNGV